VVPSAPEIEWEACTERDCIGAVAEDGRCLGHLGDHKLGAALDRQLGDGVLDARGAPIYGTVLARILDALRDARTHEAKPTVLFGRATFSGDARFSEATFSGDAWFGGTTFSGDASFSEATFSGDAWFGGTTFERAREFGPLLALAALDLDAAAFDRAIRIEVSSNALSCRGTRFREGANLQVRWAEVVLDEAEFAGPSILATAEPNDAIKGREGELAALCQGRARLVRERSKRERSEQMRLEQARSGRARIVSLRRANVGNLALSGVDLAACRFEGAHNLDGLRTEGATFAQPPSGWGWNKPWPFPRKWTPRHVLGEEHEWRSHQADSQGWYPPECWPPWGLTESGSSRTEAPRPQQIAPIYRDLRKGREDNKDEPGAADFYYGEMEMRRQRPRSRATAQPTGGDRLGEPPDEHGGDARADASAPEDAALRSTPLSERLILALYWLVSGYGLRASRALTALLVTVVLFAVCFWAIGFGSQPPGRSPDFIRALLFSVESTSSLFRVPDTPGLTRIGEALQIVLRLIGPLFFGLALLSLRGRVKR